MTFDLFIEAAGLLADPHIWLGLVAGVTMGVIVGAMPGLSATMGVALLVPFTFGLPVMPALAMLTAVYYGAVFGGSIPAILIRTPGTPASAATIVDGHPLAQRGEAGRALSVAAAAALAGGVIGALFLILLAPQISGFALRFGPPEYFALAVLGLTMIVAVSGRSLLNGGVVAAAGLLLATVGMDPLSGYPRFIFGSVSLMEGMPFIPVLIGLFAIAEALRASGESGSLPSLPARGDRLTLISRADLRATSWTMIKSGVSGTLVGATPGAGSDTAAFIGYGGAKSSAKAGDRFGEGEIKGVAAPEAAKTAATSGAMIPLLSLGVPGDSVTAVLIGAFVIHGLQPGPLLFQDHAGLVYGLFGIVFLAHVLVFGVAALGARYFVRVIDVPRCWLVPIVLLLSLVGAFAIRNNPFDVWVAVAFGVIGYGLHRWDYPAAPLLLALILGPMAEENFRRALILSEGQPAVFLTSPIAATLLAIAVVSLIIAFRRHRSADRGTTPGATT